MLRDCLARGVANGIFGLASGATWYAPDAVRRFNTDIDPSEIQFQLGTWLVRAAAINDLIRDHTPEDQPRSGSGTSTTERTHAGPKITHPIGAEDTGPTADPTSVVVTASQVPADRVRDVVKVAVSPLVATGASVTVTLTISASHPEGINRNTLDLTVEEGLRQLGIEYDLTD